MHPIVLSLAQAAGEFRWPEIPYRPFIDPLQVHEHWWIFLLPLALGISIVYKAVRMKELKGYARAVAVMTFQIVAGMIALAAASYFLVMMYAQFIAERAH